MILADRIATSLIQKLGLILPMMAPGTAYSLGFVPYAAVVARHGFPSTAMICDVLDALADTVADVCRDEAAYPECVMAVTGLFSARVVQFFEDEPTRMEKTDALLSFVKQVLCRESDARYGETIRRAVGELPYGVRICMLSSLAISSLVAIGLRPAAAYMTVFTYVTDRLGIDMNATSKDLVSAIIAALQSKAEEQVEMLMSPVKKANTPMHV